jgi:hypothetical protein
MALKDIEDKGFLFLFLFSLLLFSADFITTIWSYEVLEYLEVNALYQMTGTLLAPIALNIIVFACCYWLYTREKSTPNIRFMIINILVVISLTRMWALHNNIYWMMNPPTVAQAQAVATEAAVQATRATIALLNYVPLFLTFITYVIWKVDHRVWRK